MCVCVQEAEKSVHMLLNLHRWWTCNAALLVLPGPRKRRGFDEVKVVLSVLFVLSRPEGRWGHDA